MMADTPRSASLPEALVRQGLAGTGASELLRPAFSLLVLDFNQELLLVSGACVTREGQARPIWIAPGARLLELFSALDRQVVAPLVTDALSGRPGMTKLEAGATTGDRVLRISILPRQVDGRQCGVILSAQCVSIYALETLAETQAGLTPGIGYYYTNPPRSALAGASPRDDGRRQIQAPRCWELAPDGAIPEHQLAA